VASGTVITSNEHGVRGLDPLTGDERWHYLRPNATMCDLTVLVDVVVAIFKTTGRCNEAVALEAGTGVRRWYRNVDFSDELSMLGSGTAALAATPGGIAVLDAVGNSIRWRYNPPQGCELSSIGIGISGVVVLERCTTGTTWLAEFELESGDQQWRVAPPPGDVTVLGADGVVSLLVGQQLIILSARDGSLVSTMTTAAESDESAATMSAGPPGGQGVPLVYLAGQLYAIEPAGGAQLWSVAATGLPANGDSAVVVPEAGAFVTRNLVTGEEIARSPIGDASGSQEGGLEGLVRVELAGSVLIAVTQNGLVSYG
jgi:outer membrane protein assembly factor BamB